MAKNVANRVAQLEQLIEQLTQCNTELQEQVTNLANAQAQAQQAQARPQQVPLARQAPAAPNAAAPVRFAVTPGLHDVDQLIDYSKKQGTALYEQGTKALTNKFNMKPDSTVIFIQSFKARCKEMGWSEGAMNITKFPNTKGDSIDLIMQYGQIDSATLKNQCVFAKVGGAKFET